MNYLRSAREEFQSLIHQVSVSFGFSLSVLLGKACREFQSLIHQVSVSFKSVKLTDSQKTVKFQSLIHQVSVSFLLLRSSEKTPQRVSIPYSSGQCFF